MGTLLLNHKKKYVNLIFICLNFVIYFKKHLSRVVEQPVKIIKGFQNRGNWW